MGGGGRGRSLTEEVQESMSPMPTRRSTWIWVPRQIWHGCGMGTGRVWGRLWGQVQSMRLSRNAHKASPLWHHFLRDASVHAYYSELLMSTERSTHDMTELI